MSDEAILSDFPDLTRDDIRTCRAFAAARDSTPGEQRCHIHDIGGDFAIEETAYHEAGHAVVSVYLNLPFDYVSIEPEGDAGGHVSYAIRRFRRIPFFAGECCHGGPMCANCGAQSSAAEAQIVFELAGAVALFSYRPQEDRNYGDDGDRISIAEICRLVFGDNTDEQIARRVQPLVGRAQLLLLKVAPQPESVSGAPVKFGPRAELKAVADALLVKKRLTADEVREIILSIERQRQAAQDQ